MRSTTRPTFAAQARAALAAGRPLPLIRGGDGSTEPDVTGLLARVASRQDLDLDGLAQLETDLVAAFDLLAGSEQVDDATLEQVGQLADAIDQVRETAGEQVAAAEQRQATLDELRSRVHAAADGDGSTADDTDDTDDTEAADQSSDGDDNGEDGDSDASDANGNHTAAVADVPEQIAAAATQSAAAAAATAAPVRRVSLAQLRQNAPAPPAPTNSPGLRPPVIRAAADLAGGRYAAGAQIGWDDVATMVIDRIRSVGRHQGPDVSMRVATVDWSDMYPADRHLTAAASPRANSEVIDRVVDPAGLGYFVPDQTSLTAAGGLCNPLPTAYDVETISVAERPLRAALPGFMADRGGIQFMTPYKLSDIIVDNTNGAVDLITVAADASGATKTIQEMTCPTSQEVQVQAIPLRLRFGNFADRYWPEGMRQAIDLGRAAHARFAERLVFEQMRAAATAVTTGPVELGAYRDYVGHILTAARGYRYRHRMSDDAPLRAVIPEWLITLLFIDLLKQAPGDDVVGDGVEARRILERDLAVENIRPIYQRDDARTNDANGAGGPAFGAQSAGALLEFPGRVSTLLFHEGAYTFLDGGTLDLGVTIRDSALNEDNRFEMFFETFEAVAFRGVEAYNVNSALCASGAASALVAGGCGGLGS
jgi:hypothetical protein